LIRAFVWGGARRECAVGRPYLPFRLEDAIANARSIPPGIEILQVSNTTGAGLDDWLRWLERRTGGAVNG
jgi:hypothetical protein